ncbi:MAG TPA: low affinity iron permease family protein [Moraxellaceae bacterium]
MKKKPSFFTKLSMQVSVHAGRPATFFLALSTVIVWGVSGPLFGFSDTWQLVINTGTTIVTFLMVFLIQNTQNRDSEALQIKLDELIHCLGKANNSLLDLEEMDESELDRIRQAYLKAAREARSRREGRDMPDDRDGDVR